MINDTLNCLQKHKEFDEDCLYLLNESHLTKHWDDVGRKCVHYVIIVFVVYIICVVVTILHDTYKNYGTISWRCVRKTLLLCLCTKPVKKPAPYYIENVSTVGGLNTRMSQNSENLTIAFQLENEKSSGEAETEDTEWWCVKSDFIKMVFDKIIGTFIYWRLLNITIDQ